MSRFPEPALGLNVCSGPNEWINQLSKSFAPVPFLTLQCSITDSTSPKISWCYMNLKFRTKLLDCYAVQQPSPLMPNAELKYFHVAAWISSPVGKDFLCWHMPANYISIWHPGRFTRHFSTPFWGYFICSLQHQGGELIPLGSYRAGGVLQTSGCFCLHSAGRCDWLSLHQAAATVPETHNNLKSFSLMTA